MEESHALACCHAQVCGDGIQGDHSSNLSSFEGDPDFCGRIQSLDVISVEVSVQEELFVPIVYDFCY